MQATRILHNPRCSKSRQTKQLLEEKGIAFEVIEYLKTPPSEADIRKLMSALGIENARDMMRTKESEYKQQGLGEAGVDNDALITAMHQTPKLIERPIVVNGDKAKIGRPPEAVLELF